MTHLAIDFPMQEKNGNVRHTGQLGQHAAADEIHKKESQELSTRKRSHAPHGCYRHPRMARTRRRPQDAAAHPTSTPYPK
jgi:hypothetical protein